MPKSFSEDGALGAGGGGTDNTLPGQSTGGFTANDWNSAGDGGVGGWDTGSKALGDYTQSQINGSGGVFETGGSGPRFRSLSASERAGDQAYTQGMGNGTPGNYSSGPGGFSFSPLSDSQTGGGLSFEDGGEVPGGNDNDADDQPGQTPDHMDHLQQRINAAIATVDNALSYGRKLHGLGSDGGEDSFENAAAMPMIPGNQSETPGPYKPGQPRPQQMSAAMPMIPGSQSETPGPYRPGDGQKTAAAMPMIPGSQSETPGPYVPAQPKQKLADNDSGALPVDEQDQEAA